MNIEDLLLTREEAFIRGQTVFHLPVHPKLLELQLNHELAKQAFIDTIETY